MPVWMPAVATMQGTGVREISQLVFYQYLLAILTVSLFCSAGLVLFVR